MSESRPPREVVAEELMTWFQSMPFTGQYDPAAPFVLDYIDVGQTNFLEGADRVLAALERKEP